MAVVLGGDGFIGRYVVAELRSRGVKEVTVLHRSMGFDVTAPELPKRLTSALSGATALINLIGVKCAHPPTVTWQAMHVATPMQAFQACRAARVRHLVHISALCTPSVESGEDDMPHPYARTKWEGEQRLLELAQHQNDVVVSIVRPSVVFGPGDDCITNLLRGLRHCILFPLPNGGNAEQQPIHVQVSQAHPRIASTASKGDSRQTCGGAGSVFATQRTRTKLPGPIYIYIYIEASSLYE